jgi:hypothetical protein
LGTTLPACCTAGICRCVERPVRNCALKGSSNQPGAAIALPTAIRTNIRRDTKLANIPPRTLRTTSRDIRSLSSRYLIAFSLCLQNLGYALSLKSPRNPPLLVASEIPAAQIKETWQILTIA